MPVQFKDYYATLGVARTATADEIKSAFRKLARKYHPDVAKDKKAAEEKFKEINEANEVLSDPEKRRRYDELGAEWQSGGMPSGGATFRRGGRTAPGGFSQEGDFEFGGTGFSDFFEQFFGSGGLGGFRRRTGRYRQEEPAPEQGEDFEADILVTLEEALKGSTRQITVRRAGDEGAAGPTRTYQVRIPPGIREGQRIRLAGQGHPGQGGGAAGDIYLRVRFARDPDFAVDGDDVTFELELAPWEAVLGAKVTVPTLDGATALRIPPGTAAGSRLRLRGLGLPHAGGGRGDLYALVRIQVPTETTAAETDLWEKLAKSSSFRARED